MIEKKKKQYTKPMIAFEDMQLNSAIADMCDWITVFDCAPNADHIYPTWNAYDGQTYFIEALSACLVKDECYHNPTHNIPSYLMGQS